MKKSSIKALARRVSKKFKIPVPGKEVKLKGTISDGVISYF